MPATLVVIDMQPYFEAACHAETIVGVTEQILLTKQKRGAIIFVEFRNCGKTHIALRRLVKDYPYTATTIKSDDDGSQGIVKVLKRKGFNKKVIRVCGINTDCCVYETVEGLMNRLPKSQIKVVKKACFSEHAEGKEAFCRFYEDKHLKLV